MVNSSFSSLVYQIIGKPEVEHDGYVDIIQQVLDESKSFDDPNDFSELLIGDRILSRISDSNEALAAFSTLLDQSRFKIIILNESFKPLYNNRNATELHKKLLNHNDTSKLHPALLTAISKSLPAAPDDKHAIPTNNNLIQLDYPRVDNDRIYLRYVQNNLSENAKQTNFYLLLVLDQSRQQNQLNPDLVSKYEFTAKEQAVLINLIHGKSIKQIATDTFVSENTVKTHLKSLFRKTETKSQTDVVRLILTHESQILDSYFDSSPGLADNHDNDSADKVVALDDGFEISYREYGPNNGHPVIVFHNGYGSRLMIPPGYKEICQRTNRRIIIPDRPGYGQTAFMDGHPEHWHNYMNELIDKLEIDQYDVLGSVLGTPLAMCFAAQADNRLQRLVLASPVFVNSKDDTKHLAGILAPSHRLVKASRRFARETYELWLKSITMNLGKHYRSMLESGLGESERAKFAAENTVDIMVNTFREASAKSFSGISYEMLFCITPRKLDLNNIQVPVDLWWGTEDNRIAREGVEKLAEELPNSTLHIKEGYSEHIYFALFEEMIG